MLADGARLAASHAQLNFGSSTKMRQNNFWSRHRAAVDAGLNAEWALKVAYGCIELDDALGAMDHDAESTPSGKPPALYVHSCTCTVDSICQPCKDEIPF